MPQDFADNADRNWLLTIDTLSNSAVRAANDVDLPTLDASAMMRVWDDLLLGNDVAWTLCKSQAEAIGVDYGDFQRQLTGDAIGRFQTALLAAVSDFLPKSKRSTFLRAAEESEKARLQAFARAIERFDDPAAGAQRLAAIDAAIDGALSAAYSRPAK
jgi:hypothetical protein